MNENFYVLSSASMNDCKYTSRVHESHSHTERRHRLTYTHYFHPTTFFSLPQRNLSANLIFQFSSLFTHFFFFKKLFAKNISLYSAALFGGAYVSFQCSSEDCKWRRQAYILSTQLQPIQV